jgi:hypothetical protein
VILATTMPVRPRTLRRGEVVTLLVGVGLDLQRRHDAGRVFGPVHPAHVRVDAHGRPQLASVEPPADWTPHDDWVGLLRFGRLMGRADETSELSWWSAGRREGTDLLRWLLEWADPEPLERWA